MSAFRSAFYRQCLPTSLHTVGNRPIQVISRSMAINTTTATLATTGRHRRPARIDRETQYSGFLDIDSAASRAMKSLYRIPADPFVAAKRVEKILEKTTHDDALEYLTHLRVGLQSTAAWNSLLKHCAAQGKSKLAESDYVQMRKRGIEPNQHTHTIMISALGNSKSPHAMAKAEGWLKERIKDGPSVVHYNALLTVYKQHGLSMREAWDRIKSDKSFRPDAITYSILFQCAKPGDESRVRRAWQEVLRRVCWSSSSKESSSSSSRKTAAPSLLAQKAKKVEKELGIVVLPDDGRGTEESDFEIDEKLAANIVSALLRTDIDYAFGTEVMAHLYGLRCSSSTQQHPQSSDATSSGHSEDLGLVPTVYSLDMMLRFFGSRKAFREGREFYELALKKFPGLKPDRQLEGTQIWLKSRRHRAEWKQQQQNNNNKQ